MLPYQILASTTHRRIKKSHTETTKLKYIESNKLFGSIIEILLSTFILLKLFGPKLSQIHVWSTDQNSVSLDL